jgi:hypothetical protein
LGGGYEKQVTTIETSAFTRFRWCLGGGDENQVTTIKNEQTCSFSRVVVMKNS